MGILESSHALTYLPAAYYAHSHRWSLLWSSPHPCAPQTSFQSYRSPCPSATHTHTHTQYTHKHTHKNIHTNEFAVSQHAARKHTCYTKRQNSQTHSAVFHTYTHTKLIHPSHIQPQHNTQYAPVHSLPTKTFLRFLAAHSFCTI